MCAQHESRNFSSSKNCFATATDVAWIEEAQDDVDDEEEEEAEKALIIERPSVRDLTSHKTHT